ncbi:unnamed protein product [Pocillopora meandrina]|uniref:LAGLIDADG endonuclease n=1 Tax=Pocillopora meandrina TaxID=46732 RepID=A0AAU9XKP1_9CNID|nr:unnamed protein product [Pocillopora meandrina]
MLKLSNGEKMEIPNVVRTVISSRLIHLYHTYCIETNFKPLGRSTLFNILKMCTASQKKSSAGLDSTQTDGVNAVASLEEIIDFLKEIAENDDDAREIASRLRAGKRYLSTDFKLHISSTFSIVQIIAVSDEAEYRETCSHQHSIGCEVFFFMSISHILQSKIEFYQQIVECRWKSHIVRSVHQDAAKTAAVDTLSQSSVFLIMN